MIRLRLFGLLRLDSGIKELSVEAAELSEALAALEAASEKLSREQLENCVVLLNGRPCGKKCRLRDGDELTLLSPAAGG